MQQPTPTAQSAASDASDEVTRQGVPADLLAPYDLDALGPAPRRETLFATKKGEPVACPVPPAEVADSHTHLTSLRHVHPAVAVARAALAGVGFLVTVVDPTEDACDAGSVLGGLGQWEGDARRILDAWGFAEAAVPRVRMLVGCHPHNARLFDENARREMRALLAHPLCAGVGEIGLDYHYDLSPRDEQRRVFAEQLELAIALDAPLSLHIREAHAEAYEIMVARGIPKAGAVLHCFDLGWDVAEPFLGMGCHLGLGGAVTFARNEDTRQAALRCPPNRIVIETDAPYMAPVPLRGNRCEPAYAALNCAFVADLRACELGESQPELYASFSSQAHALFDAREGFELPCGALS